MERDAASSWNGTGKKFSQIWSEAGTKIWKNWLFLMGLEEENEDTNPTTVTATIAPQASAEPHKNNFEGLMQDLASFAQNCDRAEDWHSIRQLWLKLVKLRPQEREYENTSQLVELRQEFETLKDVMAKAEFQLKTVATPTAKTTSSQTFVKEATQAPQITELLAKVEQVTNNARALEQQLEGQLKVKDLTISNLQNQLTIERKLAYEKAKSYEVLQQKIEQQAIALDSLQEQVAELKATSTIGSWQLNKWRKHTFN
jgi:glycogen debranching enzyme